MIDPRAYAIFNMGSLLYNDGETIPMIFEEFPEPNEINKREYIGPTVILENKKLEKIFAHFFCSF